MKDVEEKSFSVLGNDIFIYQQKTHVLSRISFRTISYVLNNDNSRVYDLALELDVVLLLLLKVFILLTVVLTT